VKVFCDANATVPDTDKWLSGGIVGQEGKYRDHDADKIQTYFSHRCLLRFKFTCTPSQQLLINGE
jgi:hypothetical protein